MRFLEVTMGMATQSGNLISSENAEVAAADDHSGNKIGQIDHLMIDKVSGIIRYPIMTGRITIGSSACISISVRPPYWEEGGRGSSAGLQTGRGTDQTAGL